MDSKHCWDDLLGEEEALLANRIDGMRKLGGSPALLMIDLYNRVYGDRQEPLAEAIGRFPSTAGPSAWDAIGPIQDLAAAARTAEIPIAHTTGEHREESRLGGSSHRSGWAVDADEWGYAFFASHEPREGEFVVRKTRASAFFGTPLAAWLRTRGVDSLIVAGESTSGCVRASVVDAFSLGFKVAVVEECVFDRSPLSHKVNLFDMNLKYASVIHLSDAVELLGGRSGNLL